MLSERAHIWHGDQHLGADGTRKRAVLGEGDATGARQVDEVAAVDGVAARLLHHPGVVAERVERGEELLDHRRVEAVREGLGGEDGLVAGDRLPRATQHHCLAALDIEVSKAEPLVVPRPAAAEHLVQRVDLEGLVPLGLTLLDLSTPSVSCSFFWSSTTAAPRLAHPGVEPRPPRIACTLRGNTPEATLRCMCSTFETSGSTACIVRSGARTA